MQTHIHTHPHTHNQLMHGRLNTHTQYWYGWIDAKYLSKYSKNDDSGGGGGDDNGYIGISKDHSAIFSSISYITY